MDVDDEEDGDCSDEFYLMAHAEAPVAGEPDGPYVMVTSPAEGDAAMAGEEYTVEVRGVVPTFCDYSRGILVVGEWRRGVTHNVEIRGGEGLAWDGFQELVFQGQKLSFVSSRRAPWLCFCHASLV